MGRWKFWLPAVALLTSACANTVGDHYVQASVDPTGVLRLKTDTGRDVLLEKEPEQTEFDQIAVSPDGRSVGWLALYPNAATSYPIPLKLIVYFNGKAHAFTGNELPVWQWQFEADGNQVAFEQETVHGGLGIHYELRDISSGRLIAEFDPTVDQGGQPDPNQKKPDWVARLDRVTR